MLREKGPWMSIHPYVTQSSHHPSFLTEREHCVCSPLGRGDSLHFVLAYNLFGSLTNALQTWWSILSPAPEALYSLRTWASSESIISCRRPVTPGVYCRQVGGIHSDYNSLFFLSVFLLAYPIIPFYNSSLYNSHPPGLFLFFGNAEEKAYFFHMNALRLFQDFHLMLILAWANTLLGENECGYLLLVSKLLPVQCSTNFLKGHSQIFVAKAGTCFRDLLKLHPYPLLPFLDVHKHRQYIH